MNTYLIDEPVHYSIETDAFSGPFDTLLDLIKKHKLDLLDLDLEQLTMHYLAFIDENIHLMNFDEASEYMLISSKLVAMKARYINEQAVNLDADINDIDDDDIVNRLIRYKLYKDIVPKLNQRYFERQLKCEKEKGSFNIFNTHPLGEYKLKSNYDVEKLAEHYTRLLQIFQHKKLSANFDIKVKELKQSDIQNDLVAYLHQLGKDVFSLLEYFYSLPSDHQSIEYFCGLFLAILYQIKVGSIEYILVRDEIDINFKIIDRTKAERIEIKE